MEIIFIIKWLLGTLFGIIGAVLLSQKTKYSKYGYIFFTISSLSWCYIGYLSDDMALVTMNMIFLLINCNGIWNWIVKRDE